MRESLPQLNTRNFSQNPKFEDRRLENGGKMGHKQLDGHNFTEFLVRAYFL
jgi:hypothetical protein